MKAWSPGQGREGPMDKLGAREPGGNWSLSSRLRVSDYFHI